MNLYIRRDLIGKINLVSTVKIPQYVTIDGYTPDQLYDANLVTNSTQDIGRIIEIVQANIDLLLNYDNYLFKNGQIILKPIIESK